MLLLRVFIEPIGSRWMQASEEDHSLASELFDRLPGLLTEGKLKPNSVLTLHGLEKISEGFDMYRKGAYSAQKIVYEL